MKDVLLSVCIPTYNRPGDLKACLFSIIRGVSAADLEKLEIVITDNSDNDLTGQMAEEFKKVFPGLIYIKNEVNIGGPHNLFQALNSGQGKYLWLLGDDDLVLSGKTAVVMGKLARGDYAAAILNFAQGNHDNPEILLLENCLGVKKDRVFQGHDELFAGSEFLNFFAINFMSALVFNREDFKAVYKQASQFINTCYPQSYIFLQ